MNQIEKNTVKAENQLAKNQFITFINPEGKGKRVLFVGNSITRHGVKHDIGWHNDWGMAASSLEKDYVHLVAKEILQKDSQADISCFSSYVYKISVSQKSTVFIAYYVDTQNFNDDSF